MAKREIVAIERGSMFDALLVADPSFQPAYDEHLATYADEPEPLDYLALSDLARHLIAKLEAGDTVKFGEIFAVVEAWNVDGSRYVKEAAAVGLLEDLQNKGLYKRVSPADLVQWLGPRSRIMWDRVEKSWEDGTPISSD